MPKQVKFVHPKMRAMYYVGVTTITYWKKWVENKLFSRLDKKEKGQKWSRERINKLNKPLFRYFNVSTFLKN